MTSDDKGHSEQLDSQKKEAAWLKRIFLAFMALVLLGIIYGNIFPPPPPPTPTPEQLRTESEADAKSRVDAKAKYDEMQQEKYLCHQVTVCKKFATTRQECATAGDFKNCISVKMGEADAELTGGCDTEGSMLFAPPNMPNYLRCLALNNLPG